MYTASESRYEKMKYNRVGRSGLLFPAVSLGFWHNFGTNGNYENMRAMMRTAFDKGTTSLDALRKAFCEEASVEAVALG